MLSIGFDVDWSITCSFLHLIIVFFFFQFFFPKKESNIEYNLDDKVILFYNKFMFYLNLFKADFFFFLLLLFCEQVDSGIRFCSNSISREDYIFNRFWGNQLFGNWNRMRITIYSLVFHWLAGFDTSNCRPYFTDHSITISKSSFSWSFPLKLNRLVYSFWVVEPFHVFSVVIGLFHKIYCIRQNRWSFPVS